MKIKLLSSSIGLCSFLWSGAAWGQAAVVNPAPQYSTQGSVASAATPQGSAVSYASVSQLNGLLSQLEAASKSTQTDLAKLRIERWKTDGGSKKRSLSDADSVQRNLQNALPEMIGQLRN